MNTKVSEDFDIFNPSKKPSKQTEQFIKSAQSNHTAISIQSAPLDFDLPN